MKLYLFDDSVADAWHPFSLSRPCGELLFGALLLRERIERWAGVPASGHLTRPWLSRFPEEGAPAVLETADLPEDEVRLLVSARAVPADGSGPVPASVEGPVPPLSPGSGPVTLRMDGRVVGALIPAGTPTPDPRWLADPEPLPGASDRTLDGQVLDGVWELVSGFPDRLRSDLHRVADAVLGNATDGPRLPGGRSPVVAGSDLRPLAELPAGVHRLGGEPVLLGSGVRIEPGVVLDARQGPVLLASGAEVRAGTRLSGPLAAGPGSRLLGGEIGLLAAGPVSYLRGEIEETVVLGYSNKAHDGFLGHAYLGRWVNLGAMTTNSDLKNNYGTVRLGQPGGDVETGLLKLGCLLGDHVKTGIGTLLTTGASVGAGSNLFGPGMPPRWVPPFSWGSGAELVEYRKAAFLDTSRTVMERRGVEWDRDTEAWLGSVWEAGRGRDGGGA